MLVAGQPNCMQPCNYTLGCSSEEVRSVSLPVVRVEEQEACSDNRYDKNESNHGCLSAATRSDLDSTGLTLTMPVEVAADLHLLPPPPASTIRPYPM